MQELYVIKIKKRVINKLFNKEKELKILTDINQTANSIPRFARSIDKENSLKYNGLTFWLVILF